MVLDVLDTFVDLAPQFRGRLWTIGGILRHHPAKKSDHGRRLALEALERRIAVKMLAHHLRGRSAEGRLPFEHVPKSDPERINVRPHVGFPLFELFRTGEMRRAHKTAGGQSGRVFALGPGIFRKAKVDHFHGKVATILADEHDVRWLDIAMHQPLLLGGSQRACHLRGNFQSHQDWNSAFTLDECFDGLPIDKLHRIEIVVTFLPEMKDRRHIRVPERRGRTSLTQESLPGRLAIQISRIDDLERDVTTQVRIESLVGNPHGASSQLIEGTILASQKFKMLEPNRLRHVCASSNRRTANYDGP